MLLPYPNSNLKFKALGDRKAVKNVTHYYVGHSQGSREPRRTPGKKLNLSGKISKLCHCQYKLPMRPIVLVIYTKILKILQILNLNLPVSRCHRISDRAPTEAGPQRPFYVYHFI